MRSVLKRYTSPTARSRSMIAQRPPIDRRVDQGLQPAVGSAARERPLPGPSLKNGRERRLRLQRIPLPLLLGTKLMLIVTADGTVTGFCLANPKLTGEREQVSEMLRRQPPTARAPAR